MAAREALGVDADEPDGDGGRWLVYDGDAFNAEAWEGLLKEIGRVEGFGVAMNHADTLRRMWTEWLVEKKRGDDERGFWMPVLTLTLD